METKERSDLEGRSPDDIDPGLRARFWSKVERQPGADGCWIWKGRTRSACAPGEVMCNGIKISARILAVWLSKGYLINDKSARVSQKCGVKKCLRKVRGQFAEHESKRQEHKLTSRVNVRAHPANYHVGHGEDKKIVERHRRSHVRGPKDAPMAVRKYILAEESNSMDAAGE